jgi:hypothetical protein
LLKLFKSVILNHGKVVSRWSSSVVLRNLITRFFSISTGGVYKVIGVAATHMTYGRAVSPTLELSEDLNFFVLFLFFKFVLVSF